MTLFGQECTGGINKPHRPFSRQFLLKGDMILSNLRLSAFALILTAVPLVAGHADVPGKHPAYLHALSDLRAARWMLEHRPGDAAVNEHEQRAVQQIDQAIGDIKQASIDDGKNLNDHPQVDVPTDGPGRLHNAQALLQKVHSDIAQEEEDPATRDLKHRSLEHINDALHETDLAIGDVEHHH